MLLPETLKVHNRSEFEFHYIYFLPWKNQMVDSITEHGGQVTCISASNNVSMLLRIRAVIRYAKDHRIDLIHAHLPWAGIVARLAGRFIHVPVVYSEHNKLERYHSLTRWMNVGTMDLTKVIVAVSNDVNVSVRKFKPALSAELITISNGVNTQHFSPGLTLSARRELGIPEGVPVIGTVAVFRNQKRLDLWMEVAAKVRSAFPDCHFILLGDGPLRDLLHQKREELGLKDRIHMPGLKTEVRPYLEAMDVYFMSSMFEGLPIALLEAMAMEKAIVSTDAGGIKEVIRDGQDGLVSPVDAPQRLAENLVSMLTAREERKRYGIAARKRVMELFSMERMVKELEELYRRLSSRTK